MVRRPVALFVPVAAIVFSLKNCEGYIRAILIKQLERQSLNKGAGTMSRVCSVPSHARFLSASCACLCVSQQHKMLYHLRSALLCLPSEQLACSIAGKNLSHTHRMLWGRHEWDISLSTYGA